MHTDGKQALGILTVSLMSSAVRSWSCPAAPCSGTLLEPSSWEPWAGNAGPGCSLSIAACWPVSSGGCAGWGEAGPGIPSCCGSGRGKAGPGASSPYALKDPGSASGCPCWGAQPFTTAHGSPSDGWKCGWSRWLLSWSSWPVVVAAAVPLRFCSGSSSSPRHPWVSTFSSCCGGSSAFSRLVISLLTTGCGLIFIAGSKFGPGSWLLVSSNLGPLSSDGLGCCKAKFILSSLLGPALLSTMWLYWSPWHSRAEVSSCRYTLLKGPTALLDPPSATVFAPCHWAAGLMTLGRRSCWCFGV